MPYRRPSWAQLLTHRPVEEFLRRVVLYQNPIEHLVLVSPFIGPLKGVTPNMTRLVEKINKDRIRTYVITNQPDHDSQQAAVDVLSQSHYTEIRYNASLHAKVYVCKTRHIGFAMLGSGNLTATSIKNRIEVGIVIREQGPGAYIFNELWTWGLQRLRQMRASRIEKRMTMT